MENGSLLSEAATLEELEWVIDRQMRYYNRERRHSGLDYRAPVTYFDEQGIHPRVLVPALEVVPFQRRRSVQKRSDPMHIHTIKTHKITLKDQNLFTILDTYVSAFEERTVLAITSKIVAICEGRVVKIGTVDKRTLIAQEADAFIPAAINKYHTTLTIKQGILIPTAGIDESNGDGYYILWPRDPQQTANAARAYLQRRFRHTHVGVIITDSKTTPLRLGVTGVALAHSGFQAINDYVGTKDLFGRVLQITKVNVVDALATAAVLVMGEGSEQTPLAVVEELPFVAFQERDPSPAEVQQLRIAVEDDLYGPLLTSVQWHQGQR